MAPEKIEKSDRLQGTLDVLILKTLSPGAMHGWGISQRIQQVSGEVLEVNQGSLYPALHRLEERGWISAEWGSSENNRRARFYSLTRSGRRQLADETESWERFEERTEPAGSESGGGFLFPWNSWMKKELRAFCDRHLNNMAGRSFVNGPNLLRFWNDFLDGKEGIRWGEIWLFVVLDHWMEKNGVS